jgi:hypothetical protein
MQDLEHYSIIYTGEKLETAKHFIAGKWIVKVIPSERNSVLLQGCFLTIVMSDWHRENYHKISWKEFDNILIDLKYLWSLT